MKSVLFMRHAKSSWSNAHLSDHDRPLNARGLAAAPRIGAMLQDIGLVPEVILSSTANRTLTTASMVAEACGYGGEIEIHAELYHGTPNDYLGALARLPDEVESAMVVGHNPCLEDLIFALTGQVEEMPTAAVAHIELPVMSWRDVTATVEATLVDVWRPNEIEA